MENQIKTNETKDSNPSPTKINIVVNGREKIWTEVEISFDQVIILAFGSIFPDPNVIYTVTYKLIDGDKTGGTMVKGDIIKAKKGMIFNASSTNRS